MICHLKRSPNTNNKPPDRVACLFYYSIRLLFTEIGDLLQIPLYI